MIRKAKPCQVCGESTPNLLFDDKSLGVSICSGKCEHQYVQTCNLSEETNMLRCLDLKIEKARRDEIVGWATAGAGVILAAVGFFATNALAFLIGVVSMAVGASSTRIFEDKREKLTKKRKRILI
jgi:hypothetical protein